MNDLLFDAVSPLNWLRFNAAVSGVLFAIMLWKADFALRWHGHGKIGAAVSIVARVSLFLTLLGCVGNVIDWWHGLFHKPSEILVNTGFATYLLSAVAATVLDSREGEAT